MLWAVELLVLGMVALLALYVVREVIETVHHGETSRRCTAGQVGAERSRTRTSIGPRLSSNITRPND